MYYWGQRGNNGGPGGASQDLGSEGDWNQGCWNVAHL